MTGLELLRGSLVSLEKNAPFSEAVLWMRDGSRLCFRHRVGERWAKSVGPDWAPKQGGVAGEILCLIAIFRLNAKHLDVEFSDGSRCEMRFTDSS